jgi:sugar O-acyltransferase (sialic acid O-acetyltransferase NeuD family)
VRRFLVLGAGGHARPVIEAIQAAGHRIAGLLDDAPGGPVLGQARLGPLGMLAEFAGSGLSAVVAIGDNALRQRLGTQLAELGISAPPLLHPSALISPSARIGAGVQVLARAVVGPEAAVGAFVLVNTAALVEHECRIGDAAHLGPGSVLCGAARVGARVLVGAGAVLQPGVTVGDDAVIAAGAAVHADLPVRAKVGGVPARPIGHRSALLSIP